MAIDREQLLHVAHLAPGLDPLARPTGKAGTRQHLDEREGGCATRERKRRAVRDASHGDAAGHQPNGAQAHIGRRRGIEAVEHLAGVARPVLARIGSGAGIAVVARRPAVRIGCEHAVAAIVALNDP